MSATAARQPGQAEFIALLAFVMALISLSIDNLLPAFAPIRSEFGIANANDLQLIVTVYMLGSAPMQIVYGTLADVVGRRPTLLVGLVLYALGALVGVLADSYPQLLAGRIIQGMGAAAIQVLAVALIRDRHEGGDMARVLSLVFMVFILVPVVAPALGSLCIVLWGWRSVFASMLVMALAAGLWFGLRMPETLSPQHRRRFSAAQLWQGVRITFAQRSAIGHSLAIALFMGCLMSYVSSSQQIFETEVYALGKWFPLAFGGVAAVMGVAFFANSHLVRSFGMHRLSHVCLLLFVGCAVLLAGVVLLWAGKPPLWLFVLLLSAIQFLMCLTMPNFNAIAMEPLGAVAGTASAVLGVLTTLGGALIGIVVGANFDGTLRPLALTYLACAVLALLAVLWGERGALRLGRA